MIGINQIWYEVGTVEDPVLHVHKKGKSIEFINASMNPYLSYVTIEFSKKDFQIFYNQLLEMAQEIWPDLQLREATSFGNDYEEYYDRELDNDGSAWVGDCVLSFRPPAPHLESDRLYRFTKTKMQTYLFDLKNYAEEGKSMKQFSVTYLNYVNKLCREFIAADTVEEAKENAKNIQGLTRIIEVKEVSTMGSTNDKT